MSFDSDGALQVGAGTTIYKDTLTTTSSCPRYLDTVAVHSNLYVSSYCENGTNPCTLLVTSTGAAAPNTAVNMSSYNFDFDIYDIVTLSQDEGTFVAISQDTTDESTAIVIAGKVSPEGFIHMGTETFYIEDNSYSLSPSIVRLSDNSFAIGYLDYINAAALTRYGLFSVVA